MERLSIRSFCLHQSPICLVSSTYLTLTGALGGGGGMVTCSLGRSPADKPSITKEWNTPLTRYPNNDEGNSCLPRRELVLSPSYRPAPRVVTKMSVSRKLSKIFAKKMIFFAKTAISCHQHISQNWFFFTCFFLVRNLRKSQHFRHFRRFSQKYEIDFLRNILLHSKNPNFRFNPPPQPTWAEITTYIHTFFLSFLCL
jgi:hypothetical protein